MASPRFPPLEIAPIKTLHWPMTSQYTKNTLQYQKFHESLNRDNFHCWSSSHMKPVDRQHAISQRMEPDINEASRQNGVAENKVNVTVDSDEIENWKRERRKNYPSAQNVAKRQAQQEEKMKRGELLCTKEFHKFKGRFGKTSSNDFFKRRPKIKKPLVSESRGNDVIPFKEVPFRKRSRKRPGKFNGDISKGRSKGRERKRLNKFNGTQLGNKDTNELTIARGENVDHAITDSDCEATLPNCCDADAESAKLPTDKEKSKCFGGIFAGAPVVQGPSSVPNALKDLIATYQSDPEVEENDQPTSITDLPSSSDQNIYNPKSKYTENHHKKQRITLLERLLAKEIRHERNVILQCVRYIVQKGFFDAKAEDSK